MLQNEILELVKQGEGAKLEFKRDEISSKDLAKQIVSFANMNGGRILLGVEDDGTFSGVQRAGLQAWLMDSVIGKHVHPHILPDYEEVTVDNKKIVVLTVPMGTAKPYCLKYKDHQDIYVRYGNTCQLASRERQVQLFESGGLVAIERFPVPGSVADELDERRYQEYFMQILGEKGISDWHNVLLHRGFLVGDQSPLNCSYFAYALFAKDPQRRLPQAGVRVTVYPGNEKDYSTLFDEDLSLPLLEYRGRHADQPPVEMALHEKVITILQAFISKECLHGITRKRQWDYHQEVLRELLVNAFVHRDWSKQDYVRVVAYNDRLEIISPGALANGMTVEKIKHGGQSHRNPACIRIFKHYGYLEDQGMGIHRKVIPLTLEHSGRAPEFEATEEYFKVRLWKKN